MIVACAPVRTYSNMSGLKFNRTKYQLFFYYLKKKLKSKIIFNIKIILSKKHFIKLKL